MTALTAEDYANLLPHREVIKTRNEIGYFTRCPILDVIAPILQQRYGFITNKSCGDCIYQAYSRIWEIMKQYERDNNKNIS